MQIAGALWAAREWGLPRGPRKPLLSSEGKKIFHHTRDSRITEYQRHRQLGDLNWAVTERLASRTLRAAKCARVRRASGR